MKKQRLLTLLLSAIAVLLVALVGYGHYLGEETRALRAGHGLPPAAEPFVRIQETLQAESIPAQDRENGPGPAAPDEATRELVDNVKAAEAILTRADTMFRENTAWNEVYDDLFSRPQSTWSAADWERLSDVLVENSDVLAEVYALANGNGPLYPLDFSQGYHLPLPHLSTVRSMARLLQASAISRAHSGDEAGAAADLLAGVRLSSRLEEEPLIISQLVRVAIDAIMYQGVIESFPPGEIPPELLAQLSAHHEARDLPGALTAMWQMEGNMGVEFMSGIMNGGWQSGQAQLREFFPHSQFPGGDWAATIYASPFARPWQHLDMIAFGQAMDAFEPTLAQPFYEARPVIEEIQGYIDSLPRTRAVTHGLVPAMMAIHRSMARAQTYQYLLSLGAAVESYANENGTYPANLGDLQGDTSIIDPHTGAPFQYRTDGDTFQLYSVGPDLTDDGGEHDVIDGDIVWRGTRKSTGTTGLVATR